VVPLRKIRFLLRRLRSALLPRPQRVEFLDGTMQVVPKPDRTLTPATTKPVTKPRLRRRLPTHVFLPEPFPPRRLAMPLTPRSISISPAQPTCHTVQFFPLLGIETTSSSIRQPVTYDSNSDNGEETVSTILLGGVDFRHLARASSAIFAPSSPATCASPTPTPTTPSSRLPTSFDGIGRSDQLPRATREHRAKLAETLSLDTSRHSFKFAATPSLLRSTISSPASKAVNTFSTKSKSTPSPSNRRKPDCR